MIWLGGGLIALGALTVGLAPYAWWAAHRLDADRLNHKLLDPPER